ncbi:MAG: MBOAT family protein [Alphaproteobacteria bacterium]|nr:MBOAT family protein [Alphaproteobacteria bacterium]
MLFNSSVFLFAFLPLVLFGYYTTLRFGGKLAAQLVLFAASLIFYSWVDPSWVLIILSMMAVNYFAGMRLIAKREKWLLAAGIAFDLIILGYYKYTAFFVENVNAIAATDFVIPKIILPLGISFFTFQMIAFLADCYKRQAPAKQNWISFGLFVSFFPQLIAGPIVHHKEMMPQFDKPKAFNADNMAVGLCLLAIGLFKKAVVADTLATYVDPLFAAAETGPLHMVEAWTAMLAYTFQIYFDFSGYSDMALGLGKMFGIRLPVNFYSPYKSRNIVEFWRRWHITLSRFLRDYLYIPLGGNRKGKPRRYLNLMITMLLGGFWHGASWSFFIWGGLHGLFLIVNHFWGALPRKQTAMPVWFARTLTFLSVAVAWIFFRANTAATAFGMIGSLVSFSDLKGTSLYAALLTRDSPLRQHFPASDANMLTIILILCLLGCWLLPNSIEIMRRGKPAISGIRGFPLPRGKASDVLTWQPRMAWGVFFGIVMSLCIIKVLYEPSNVFLYFQF